MKNALFVYLLAGCVCLLSCTSEKDYPIVLRRAMGCMNARPDSALIWLATLADSIPHAPQETQVYLTNYIH